MFFHFYCCSCLFCFFVVSVGRLFIIDDNIGESFASRDYRRLQMVEYALCSTTFIAIFLDFYHNFSRISFNFFLFYPNFLPISLNFYPLPQISAVFTFTHLVASCSNWFQVPKKKHWMPLNICSYHSLKSDSVDESFKGREKKKIFSFCFCSIRKMWINYQINMPPILVMSASFFLFPKPIPYDCVQSL